LKSFPKPRFLLVLFVLALLPAGIVARGELERWAQDVEAGGRFDFAFFRSVMMPAGAVVVRRAPRDSRPVLDDMVTKSPGDADLYRMRARVEEETLDFGAAEADWKRHAELLPDRAEGELELADFYHRRLRPQDEIQALASVARAPGTASDRLLPATEQRSWKTYERIFTVIQDQALPSSVSIEQFRAWIDRYPKEPAVYARFFDFLLNRKEFEEASKLIGTYAKAFPADKIYPVRAQASIEYARGSIDAAMALYDRSYQPLWPPELVGDYFDLLKKTHRLRDFLASARAEVAAHPQDLSAASRVFYYYQQEGNLAAARRALVEYQSRMESSHAAWTAAGLWQLGRLFEAIHDYDEAARCYYALYSLPGAGAESNEESLAAIIDVLLSAPEQPIRFGEQDFSLVRDIGTLDPYPGFLNGIVSLLLNSQQPAARYAQAETSATSYFHRVQAAELLAMFDSRFPKSTRRSGLRAKLIEVYAAYGRSDAVIRTSRGFLADFPNSPERLHIALLLADALAATNRINEELAVYDQLLGELAARADHVPLGDQTAAPSASEYPLEQESAPAADRLPFQSREAAQPQGGPRSPEYARVLDRTIARLVQLKRPMQVLVLLRREIDHNPNDPGLYERLATFLDQNHLGEPTAEVYRLAMQRFPDRSWYHKLARWYLREREMRDFESLSENVIRTFSGSELEDYFRAVVASASFDAVLYRQLNLYAHQRFPHNLTFVRNLLNAYTARPTYDQAAWGTLLRQYWYYDPALRARFFSYLSSQGRLQAEFEQVRNMAAPPTPQLLASSNPAAAQFLAEGDLWRCHYEAAAPLMQALAVVYPTDFLLDRRTSDLFRSLAAYDPANTGVAVGIEENLARFEPRNPDVLTRIGDIYADRSLFSQARPYWDRVPEIDPGASGGYLQAATVFWDYFLFDDALRVIGEARKNLGNPELFAYEAGAVYEGKRDLEDALEEYVRGALAADGPSSSRSRLLQLAKRKQGSALVDRLTAEQAAGTNPSLAAISLRAEVLETLDRREALGNFLSVLANNTSSLELLEKIESIASDQGFDEIQASALEREIGFTRDPVEKIRLRLRLAQFQESKGNLDAARHTYESVYAENPKILGVVRATVDFYWNNKLRDPAIQTLLQAAAGSYPGLKTQFTFEAARKAAEAGECARARDLLAPLLQADPYNADDLAAFADTYARENNQAALRDFYLAKIKELSAAPLSREEKIARIAALRRGLIPALTRLKDYAGGVDQYIEIVKSFPEDLALTQEAAAYAGRYSFGQRLLDYFAKAVVDSPKDYRWPMVRARLETYFEDFSTAIADYNKAHQVRPDRSDLLIEQAALEERLLRFDDAADTYTTLYGLTYQDPQWMGKVAEVRAREGQSAAAVEALKKALIEGRPETPGNDFAAAARLEQWNMLDEARQFAEHGVALAGKDLLTDASNLDGVRTYARVLTRLRQYEKALQQLQAAAQVKYPPQAYPALQSALQEIGAGIRKAYNPEELAAFETFLEKQKESASPQAERQIWLPLAENAGLPGLEAQWRFELMMAQPGANTARTQEARLIELQKRRMKFKELGGELEKYWNVYPLAPDKDRLLTEAAAAYRSGEDTEDELRVLEVAFNHGALGGDSLQRYFQLLLARDPSRLVAIARTGDPYRTPARDAAANFVLASGDRSLALAAVTARGQGLPAVWTGAYTSLAGLYYSDTAPEIHAAFESALGGGTIGERVARPVDRNQHLAGEIWYYYGSRYGEFLALAGKNDAEDYLPSPLEAAPANPAAYFSLAEYYDQRGQPDRALDEFAHTLELAPDRGEADDHMAEILWGQGKTQEAAARSKQALQAFERQQDSGRVPPEFWENVRTTLSRIGAHKALDQVRPEADRLLRVYIQRNGAYQVEPLLQGALNAAGDPAAGVAWILDLSGSAPNQMEFLSPLVDSNWIPEPKRKPIYQRILSLAQEQSAKSFGAARAAAEGSLHEWQLKWIGYLLDTQQTAEAQSALNALPPETRKALADETAPFEIRIAARQGKLPSLLASYHEDPEHAPSEEVLRAAAIALRKDGDQEAARRVLEFAYTRAMDQREFIPANFLGLAELQLQAGDTGQAVALLKRMALVAGEPFANLLDAGNLLATLGHPSEAAAFFSDRLKAAPWDFEARLMLAKAQIAAGESREPAAQSLARLAADSRADYAVRAVAAATLAPLHGSSPDLGSGELNWLASGTGNASAANQPFFGRARVQAAAHVGTPEEKMLLLRAAIADHPEDDLARIEYFRVAQVEGHDQLALSALERLLHSQWRQPSYSPRSGYEPLSAEMSAQNYPQFLPGTRLSASEKSSLARDIACAYEKLNGLSEARNYLQIAADFKPSPSAKGAIEKELRVLRARIELADRDAQRRPEESPQLEQRNTVRPRLLPLLETQAAGGARP
jgi:thioredoxin-like negative regulator of GroEL